MESPRANPRGDYRDHKPPSPSTSPNSSISSSNSSCNNGGGGGGGPSPCPSLSPSLPPLTPKSNLNPNPNPSSIANSNPYPTTFIQADTQSFKQVVQMLTGSAETASKQSSNPNPNPNPNPVPKSPIPPLSKPNKKPTFKLYERRSSMKNLKMISPLIPSFLPSNPNSPASFSPRNKELLSPSILDFPKLVLSPVTPLSPDPFNRSPVMGSVAAAATAEDRAIAEKGFYLHPSPRSVAEPPKLLPLFPLTSPRMDSSSSSSPARTAAEIN